MRKDVFIVDLNKYVLNGLLSFSGLFFVTYSFVYRPQVAAEQKRIQTPYDEYRFFADVRCRPNYGGGFGSFVPFYNRTIEVWPLVV